MTTFKLNIAAIIFAIFALTACQKETMSELNSTTETSTQRNLPAAGIHIYHPTAKTSATAQTMSNKATSRERNFTLIAADAGPIFDDTYGEGNTLDKSNGACLADYSWDFKGADNIYIFEVKDQPEAVVTHYVTISELSNDLDLFVYTLDENNYVRDCKAISMNNGTTDESVAMPDLAAGFYIIVVDGWAAGVTSTYNMEFYTAAVSANPPTIAAGTENLNSVTTTQTTFVKVLDYWMDELEPPHFAAPYAVVANNADSLTIERIQVTGNTTITQTIVFDITKQEATSIETRKVTSNHGTTMTSSLSLDQIQAVTYEEAQSAPVNYSSIEFAALGSTDGIGAFVQETESKWYEYAFGSNAEHHFEEVSRDSTSISLRDAGRGITIQLDFTNMKVMYSDDNGNEFELYDIIDMF